MQEQNEKKEAKFEEYSREKILFYEKICGPCFMSLGGKEFTKDIVPMVNLKPGETVLDIGGGLGGSAFYMAKNFNVKVTSVDSSANVSMIGRERGEQLDCGSGQVVFETVDIEDKDYPPESFDAVFALASLFYVQDKVALLQRLYKFLKPGGRLLVADLCSRHDNISQNMQNLMSTWSYPFVSLEAYEQMLRAHTSFANIQAQDRSAQITDIFRSEIAKVEAEKDKFIKEFRADQYNQVIAKWKGHLSLYEKGDLKRGLLYAEKLLQP